MLGLYILLSCLMGCAPSTPPLTQSGIDFLGDWFDQAGNGARGDSLCHGLGTLKHPEISCAEMLEHAAEVDPQTRTISAVRSLECFGDVCGDFAEFEFSSTARNGNPLSETAVIKRDEGRIRLYWYRSDTLMALLRTRFPQDDPASEAKTPLQAAYDVLTANHPGLYEYPPCLDIRVSSSNLAGELMALDAIDEPAIEQAAAACSGQFCFALVGQKIAPVCMGSP